MWVHVMDLAHQPSAQSRVPPGRKGAGPDADRVASCSTHVHADVLPSARRGEGGTASRAGAAFRRGSGGRVGHTACAAASASLALSRTGAADGEGRGIADGLPACTGAGLGGVLLRRMCTSTVAAASPGSTPVCRAPALRASSKIAVDTTQNRSATPSQRVWDVRCCRLTRLVAAPGRASAGAPANRRSEAGTCTSTGACSRRIPTSVCHEKLVGC